MTPPDPVTAALDQLAAHREQIARLDRREADHFAALSGRLAEIADLAAQLAGTGPADGDPGGYQPSPAPKWWKLTGEERQEAVARLRAWVEQVYRPGYGQLAATLGPCWETHDLCLYALDIAAELWSVLYLQDQRTAGLLSAQAEYQTRILPALAEQLMTETSRCGHAQARRPLNGRAWSAS
jgi:hypothetical protein